MKTHKPKTTQEAINDLQQFLECDLYSKLRPLEVSLFKKKNQVWCREDYLRNEEEFIKYLREHFDLLNKQIEEFKKNERTNTKNKTI